MIRALCVTPSPRLAFALWCAVSLSPAQADDYRASPSTTPFILGNSAITSASDAQRFAHSVNVVDDFAAMGDGVTDDWAAFQQAEGMNASGICTYTQPTLVMVPATNAAGNIASYKLSQALRLCNNVTLQVQSPSTQILCTGTASGTDYTGVNSFSFANNGCLIGGSLATATYNSLPVYPITGALAPGAQSVTLTTPANAGNIVAGDIVSIETTTSFNGNAQTNLKMAVVLSANASTGAVALDRPMDFASASDQLRKLTNGAATSGWPNLVSGIPAYASYRVGVIGGAWIGNSSTGPHHAAFNANGGCLDCTFDVDSAVNLGFGVAYGNLFQTSTFRARYQRLNRTPMEMALNSNDNTVDFGTIDLAGALITDAPSTWAVALDQGARNNVVHIKQVKHFNGQVPVALYANGAVTSGGGDAVTASILVPSVTSAAVNTGGTNYGSNFTGNIQWSGAGCLVNPVLNVTANSSGVITTVNSVVVPGYCPTLPSSAATWTALTLNAGTGASFTSTGVLSYTASYTTLSGDGLSQVATGLTSALNALAGFTSAGFTVTASAANVLISNSTPAVYFSASGTSANALNILLAATNVVDIFAANNNDVTIDSISGGSITGAMATINDPSYTGTSPGTAGNIVRVKASNLAFQNNYAVLSGPAAQQNVITADGGWWHGPLWTPANALWMQPGAGSNFAANVGAHNMLYRINLDGANAQPSCGQNDATNVFEDLYTPQTASVTTNNNWLLASQFCTYRNVASHNLNIFKTYQGAFGPVTVSTGNVNLPGGTFSPQASTPFDLYGVLTVTASGIKTGTAGASTGTVSFVGCVITFSIPADATSWDWTARYEQIGTANLKGELKLSSTSAGTPTVIPTTCAATPFVLGNYATTFTALTGSDNNRVNSVRVQTTSPFMNSGAQ